MKKIEILAPAGNIDSLKAAVLHGADAVYFGLSEFNARIKADNFTFENLGEWVDFCHFYDVKVYLTLNIMIKENELDRLALYIRQAVLCNIDAFIVTDLATVKLCKEIAPSVPMHFSTQFGVHNLEGAIQAKKLGATRVILSRETTLAEIERIKEGVDIEIEAFVHGALCVGFSGNCYLSSMIDGNSGNRGLCKQPCRRLYESSVTDKEGYYLSTNDLCLINNLDSLKKCGVTSFKIEGRLKSAEYVASAVYAYKKALVNDLKREDVDRIKSSYARTFTEEGYLFGKNFDIINTKLQNSAGLEIGKVVKIEQLKNGLKKIYFSSNKKLQKGTGLKFIYNKKELGGSTLSSSNLEKGNYVAYTKFDVFTGANVSITQAVDTMKELECRKLKVDITLKEFYAGKYLLTICDSNTKQSIEFELDKSNEAQNGDQTAGITSVLKKGSEPFVVENVKTQIISNVLVPFSILNQKRKECFEQFKRAKLKIYENNKPNEKTCVSINKSFVKNKKIVALVSSIEQINDDVLSYIDKIIYMPYDYSLDKVGEFLCLAQKYKNPIYLGISTFLKQKDIEVLYKIVELYNNLIFGFYGNNYAIKEIGERYSKPIFYGTGFNVANNISLSELDGECVLSPELIEQELKSLSSLNTYVYALGYFPVMTMVHCPNRANNRNCNDCAFEKENCIYYKDKITQFKIKRIKLNECYFELYNGTILSLLSEKAKINQGLLLDLRNLDKEEFEKLVLSLKTGKDQFQNKTRGHFVRGVK